MGINVAIWCDNCGNDIVSEPVNDALNARDVILESLAGIYGDGGFVSCTSLDAAVLCPDCAKDSDAVDGVAEHLYNQHNLDKVSEVCYHVKGGI